jgi:hypothetical protein
LVPEKIGFVVIKILCVLQKINLNISGEERR